MCIRYEPVYKLCVYTNCVYANLYSRMQAMAKDIFPKVLGVRFEVSTSS